jgi:regulator of protease activity HflC (stomatin/prohibitin superfamily)
MAEKITKAMNDGVARTNAVEVLGLGAYAKVSNTEFALTVPNAEGNDTVVVVKLTVPKAQLPIDEMVTAYEAERAEVEARKAEREAERAAKKAQKEKEKASKAEETDEVEF